MSGESEIPRLPSRSGVVSPDVPPGLGWYLAQTTVGYALTAFVESESDPAMTLGSLGQGPMSGRGPEAPREPRGEAT